MVLDLVARLVNADGSMETEVRGPIEYLGRRGRVVVTACEDASASARSAGPGKGNGVSLMVDGGNQAMGDDAHSIAYLKFRPEIPGRAVAASLVIQNAGNPSSRGGEVRLVEGEWSEQGLSYARRPALGPVVGHIGKVESRELLRIPLKLKCDAAKEIALAIDPANTDGVDYVSREGRAPPQLEVEYEE